MTFNSHYPVASVINVFWHGHCCKNLTILWAKPCALQLNNDPKRPFWSSFFLALAASPKPPSPLLLCCSCILLPALLGPGVWAPVPALFLFPCLVCPPLSPSARLLTLLAKLLYKVLTSVHRQLLSLPKNSTISRTFLIVTQYLPFLHVSWVLDTEVGAWCMLSWILAGTTRGSIRVSIDRRGHKLRGEKDWPRLSQTLMVEPGLMLGLYDSNTQSSFADWMGLLSQVVAATGGGGCVFSTFAWWKELGIAVWLEGEQLKDSLMLPKGSNHTAFYGLCVYGRYL